MLTFKRLLAASSAVVLGAGSGYATSVYAQVTSGPSATSPGNPPLPPGAQPGAQPTDQGQGVASNFRRDATISVMQHPREGYEARGIRMGSMLVYPSVTIAPSYDDNIYATSTGEISDTVWHVSPQITASSDWNRHSLSVYASGRFNRYQDHSTENTTDYAFGANGRLDVTRDTTLNGRLDYSRNTEPRTSANSPTGALEPVQYDLFAAQVQGRHEFNRVLVMGRILTQKFEYDSPPAASGGFIPQGFRDRTTNTFEGRVDYALSPKTALFADLQTEQHNYDHRNPGNINRDSQSAQALVGVNFEVTALVRGDIGVGYRKATFDDPASKDLKGFSANGTLEWFPTQLTTFTFNASRTLEDSAVQASPGYLSSNVKARVDHELLRNVILSGQVGYGEDKYTGIVREDHRTSAGLAASYLINRSVGVSVTYDYNKQETKKGVGNNFTDNKIAATLTLQY